MLGIHKKKRKCQKIVFINTWYGLKTTALLKPISFTGQLKMTVHWNLELSQLIFSTCEAPGVNSASNSDYLRTHVRGQCREREHSCNLHGRALMTDRWLLQHFDKMKRHAPMIHLHNEEEALDS